MNISSLTKIFKMTILKKIALAPTLIICCLVMLFYFTFLGMSIQKTALNDIFNKSFQSYQYVAKVALIMNSNHSSLFTVQRWSQMKVNPQQIDNLCSQMKVKVKAIESDLQKIDIERLTVKQKKIYQDIITLYPVYINNYDESLKILQKNKDLESHALNNLENNFESLKNLIFQFLALENEVAQTHYVASINKANSIIKTFVLLSLMVVCISLLITILVIRIIKNSIKQLLDKINEIVEGEADLTKKIKIASKDELGEMANSFNQFISHLEKIIIDMKNTTENLVLTSTELETNANSMKNSSLQQSKVVNNSLTAISQLNVSMANITVIIKEAKEFSEQTATIAATGEKVTNKTVSAVNNFKIQIDSVTNQLNQLTESTKAIKFIISSITDISEQTNLLALNAAIEAARAGEQGKGFGVVAEEVRKLAEKSQKSSQEITKHLETISLQANSVKENMFEREKELNDTISLITSTTNSFQEIVKKTNTLAINMNTVAGRIHEQAESTEELALGSDKIGQLSTKVLDDSNTTSSLVTKITQISNALKDVTNKFKVS